MPSAKRKLWVSDLGPLPYAQAFELQKDLRELRIAREIPDLFLLTEHPPVFTLGKRPCEEDFLSSREEIERAGIEIFQSNRGGRITYHGPGQIVGYFIVDVRASKFSIPGFVRQIEEILIRTLAELSLQAQRDPEYPGVWLEGKKIAALGLHFDRGVSMHGFALNVSPNLAHYRHIIPCGIEGRAVTSLAEEIGESSMETVKALLLSQVEHILEAPLQKKEAGKLRPLESLAEESK